MSDFKVITPKRDIARELARRYSTMTHDELDAYIDNQGMTMGGM